MADEDKTEDPTPTKLEEAREQGDIAQSREFTNFVVFLGFAISLYFSSRHILQHLIVMIQRSFDLKSIHLETGKDFALLFNSMVYDLLSTLAPLLIGVVIFGVGASVAQFGFLFSSEKLLPDFERISPIRGFEKIFSRDTLMELLKSTLKIAIISGIFYLVLRGELKHITQLGAEPIQQIFFYFASLLIKVLFVVLIFMCILGIVDLGYQKWSFHQRMMMSRQEIKDEIKQKDGDPHIRARIRQMQRERARARMMDEVPKADVVVTNPTHVAVALKYQRGVDRAPMVVAKGAGFIALKIKEIAAKHNVPILERKQLARYLYKNVDLKEMIPESLYTAVAEVLAYVYRIKSKFNQMRGAS